MTICNSHRREDGNATCEECPLCAAETERAAIVAYGKKYADQPHPIEADTGMFSPECRGVILGFLDYISCGEHRKGGG